MERSGRPVTKGAVMRLDLDNQEVEQLLHIAEQALVDLRVELRRTSTCEYREALSIERDRLQELVEKLRSCAGVSFV